MPMPKFEKGHEKIPGSGMQKGQKAKRKAIRAKFLDFSLDEYETFVQAFHDIEDPKDKCEVYLKAVKVNLPPPTENDEDDNQSSSIMELVKRLSRFKKNKPAEEEEEE